MTANVNLDDDPLPQESIMKKSKFKLNVPLRGYLAGATLSLIVDASGAPKDAYWLRRYADAKVDNCIELVAETLEAKSLKSKNVSRSKKQDFSEDVSNAE